MKTLIKYVAFDGTEFDSGERCEAHERGIEKDAAWYIGSELPYAVKIGGGGRLLAYGLWGYYGLCNCRSYTHKDIDDIDWPREQLKLRYQEQPWDVA